jgi:hypothetical protein
MATLAPTRRRPASASMVWALGGAATVGVLLARDPNQVGSYGFCPLRAVTGLDCPLCGGLRGTYALMHGDVATALDHNVLLPLVLVVALALGVGAWARRSRAPGSSSPTVTAGLAAAVAARSTAVWWSLGVAAAVFFVLRNLPWFPYLASGA